MQAQNLQMTDDVFYQELLPTMPQKWKEFFSTLPPYCSREQVDEKSGGLICRRTLANLDLKKKGIPNARIIGKKCYYPKEAVVLWLMNYSGENITSEGV